MSFFLFVILPLLITALPFIGLLILCNWTKIKRATDLTVFTFILLMLLHFPTIGWAINLYEYNIIDVNKHGCGMDVLIFFLSGGFFALLTLIFGIYFIIRNYQFNKLIKSGSLEKKD